MLSESGGDVPAEGWDGFRDVALRTYWRPAGRHLRVRQVECGRRSFFGVGPQGQTFADEKGVGGDAQGRVMMEATPGSSLEILHAKLLFEFLIVALDTQRILTASTSALRERVAGSVERKYLVGSGSPLGHSINNHSSSRGTSPK